MRVSELIESLKQYDPKMEVWIDSGENDFSVLDVKDTLYDNCNYGHGVVILPNP